MDEEKRNKVIAAITVNAILLVFILLVVVISQIIQISVLRRRKAALMNEYNALVQEYETKKDFLDALEKEEYRNRMITLIEELKKAGYTNEQIDKIFFPDFASYGNAQLVWVAPDLYL